MLDKIIKKIYIKLFGWGLIENVNSTNFNKNCLLCYIVIPFQTDVFENYHQNQWQVKELAKIIGEFGFNVDVINFDDKKARLTKKYDLIIDVHPGLNNVYKNFMSDSCVKIAYITGSNPSFSNKAEMERLNALFKRRGVYLKQRRYAPPFDKKELESFDAIFFIGNSYNLKTYDEFNLKKIFFIKNIGYDFLKNDDFSQKSARSFLFFASGGNVHKGLDLLLDVFSKKKHLNLYVCCPLKEKDFCKLYKKELFQTNNIFSIGFVDIQSERFRKILKLCSYTVMPSCSEGIAGSVLTAMSAGLIPIVSKECGFNDDEVYHLNDCSIECIAETINTFSQMPINWVIHESIKTMKTVQTRYSKNNYSESVRIAMREMLSK